GLKGLGAGAAFEYARALNTLLLYSNSRRVSIAARAPDATATAQSRDSDVGRAQPEDARLLWARSGADAEPRPARRARHAVHLDLLLLAGLHSGAGGISYRALHPPRRVLGQRRSL